MDVLSHSVTAPDGTTLGLHTVGSGPGLVIVHGAMQSALSQRELALLLSPAHTVHLLDRRGRGASGAAPAAGTEVEVADLTAVLAATGATDVLGISSGAIIAARTALAGDGIHRLALFEPPLGVGNSLRLDLLPRFDAAMTAGDLPRAMGIAMKVAEMGPPWMFGMPAPVLTSVSRRMLASDDAQDVPVHVREMANALTADFAVVRENAGTAADFSRITVPTLLVDGTKTRPYLRAAVAALAAAIPGAHHVELAGQSHGVTQNRDQWGRPELVAPALLEFFAR